MKVLRTISVVVLAFLVVLSSSNFMLGIHLCAGEVQDVAFLSKAEACEMELKLPPCHRHLPAPCCEDETILHESEDLKIAATNFSLAAPLAMEPIGATVLVSEIIPSAPASRSTYAPYHPPLRWHDITVANRVFLI